MDQAKQNPGGAPISCDELAALLPKYLPRRESGSFDQRIEAHLSGCPTCLAALFDLSELSEAAASGAIPAASRYPRPELSFLRDSATAQLWKLDPLGRLVISFSAALLTSLRPTVGATTRSRQLLRYEQKPAPDQPLKVLIEVYGDVADATTCRVAVKVREPSRGSFEQGEIELTLEVGQVTRREVTTELGSAVFEGVPINKLGDLRLTVDGRR